MMLLFVRYKRISDIMLFLVRYFILLLCKNYNCKLSDAFVLYHFYLTCLGLQRNFILNLNLLMIFL